jgi:serine/threonine-protein kinase HipA
MPSLDVFLHDAFVGVLTPAPQDRGRVRLDVDPGYHPSVLLSEGFAVLPGRRPPADAVSNFLGGYVPEGDHRERMAAKRHIDPGDLFALLAQFGGSIAGAVTLRTQDEQAHTPRYEPLTTRALAARLRQALSDSDQGIPDDSRSTLPGYQPKVLVARAEGEADGGWAYPRGRAHSSHILKPQVPARPTRLYDEYYSHLLTRRLGLSQYASEIRRAGQVTYLAIERFDRTITDGLVTPIHQEDLAQALGLDWRVTDLKFQEPDWPTDPRRASARRIGQLLGSIPGGHAAVEAWVRHLTYHVSIGNNDAHAKNVALMHTPGGTELAQMYDALPNLFQDGLVSFNLALAIDGQFDHRRISAERLLAEIDSWHVVSPSRATAVVTDTLIALDSALGEVRPPRGASPGLPDHLHRTVTRLLAGDQISAPNR